MRFTSAFSATRRRPLPTRWPPPRLTTVPTYARRLYEMPGIAATCDFDEYKLHYYASHRTINPTGIVPAGPLVDFRTVQA